MKINVIADTISTYLTLASALLLPVVMCMWLRSYAVSDRVYHADDGRAIVAGVSNGEMALYAGPTDPGVNAYRHRARQASWGWTNRRTFSRIAGRDHVWFIGFGYAQADSLPWRGVTATGPVVALCVPIWFLALLTGALPVRLLARNMQSSAEFLAQRAAQTQAANARLQALSEN